MSTLRSTHSPPIPPPPPPRPGPSGTQTPAFPRPGDPVHAVVLAVVEQAMAPIHQRLDELEARSLYLVRLVTAGAASPPASSRRETPVDFRGGRSQRAIALVACIVALGLGVGALALVYH